MTFSLLKPREAQPPASGKIGDTTLIPDDLNLMCIAWASGRPQQRALALELADANRMAAKMAPQNGHTTMTTNETGTRIEIADRIHKLLADNTIVEHDDFPTINAAGLVSDLIEWAVEERERKADGETK